MRRRSLSVLVVTGLILAFSALALVSPSEASRSGKQIKLVDDCEPASFNAVLGAGSCKGDGDTTFDELIAELVATQAAEDWEFDPTMLTVRAGRPVILENRGGETHTFTMVEAFGGGFVEELNELSGNPVVATECAATLADGTLVPRPPSPVNVFVDADKEASFETAGLEPGQYLFECCIHPWMRIVLTVRDD